MQGSAGAEAPADMAPPEMSTEDLQSQYEQQQMLVSHLKDMVREREDSIRTKDKELTVRLSETYKTWARA